MKELAIIAKDLLEWSHGQGRFSTSINRRPSDDILRKIELVCKAIIEYDVLLNG